MRRRNYEDHAVEWRGIRIAIRYCPSWLDFYEEIYGHALARIVIEAVAPLRAPLPITETGYRSHFTTPEEIAEAGGPVSFVCAALDIAAEDPAWKEREATPGNTHCSESPCCSHSRLLITPRPDG